jgi:hypothetical protein
MMFAQVGLNFGLSVLRSVPIQYYNTHLPHFPSSQHMPVRCPQTQLAVSLPHWHLFYDIVPLGEFSTTY